MPQNTLDSQFSNGWSTRGASPRPPQSYLVDSGTSPFYSLQGFFVGPVSNISSWVLDSGATHHITNDSTLFPEGLSVSGSDQDFMGNGQDVFIKKVG